MKVYSKDEITTITGRVSRKRWPSGPWNDEPDGVWWYDEATGLPCRAERQSMGSWCGYVCVPHHHDEVLIHPWHGRVFHEGLSDIVHVHGGLTFSDEMLAWVPDPEGWWLGFDCAHLGDKVPGMPTTWEGMVSTYRTLGFVRKEVTSLAKQVELSARIIQVCDDPDIHMPSVYPLGHRPLSDKSYEVKYITRGKTNE